MTQDLVRALSTQAKACEAMGSPLNAGLLRLAADDLAADGPTAALLAPWPESDFRQLLMDAVPLRLVGALHDLVLSGEDPDLAAAYAKQVVALDTASVWIAVRDAMGRHPDRLSAFMGHEPQTNEVRRSICLVGGFLAIASETGLPLRCFEIGASAGLNSSWDRYFYRLGDSTWGDPASPVWLDTAWTGPAPPTDVEVRVVERAACDRRPPELSDLNQRRRLLAYVWADQLERLARAHAAIGVALDSGVQVEAADAVDWTGRMAAPLSGAATVLFHSVFWQYMPPASQAALRDNIAANGAQATREAPFAWLRMEPPHDDMTGMDVTLTLWPGGETRTLAHVHPHGATVHWLA